MYKEFKAKNICHKKKTKKKKRTGIDDCDFIEPFSKNALTKSA